MKRIVAGIPINATGSEIQSRFQAVYGVGVAETEAAWLAWLDRWGGGGRAFILLPE